MIEYTQHTVAFPTLSLDRDYYTDEIEVNINDMNGSLIFTFMDFGGPVRRHLGVQLRFFGDSLQLVRDSRIQWVLNAWSVWPNPDEITPAELIDLFVQMGGKPSEYHARNMK